MSLAETTVPEFTPRIYRRRLGGSDLEVSVLGIGSSSFRWGTPDICAELLRQALQLGINYYDTARSYVNGEAAVAALGPDERQRLIVATKTGARGGSYCVRDLERSLRTLSRTWIDVWMTHMIESEREYELCKQVGGFCDIASAAKHAGIVRATGASFHARPEVIRRAIEERAFDVVMFPLNLVGRETLFGSSVGQYREDLLPLAKEKGVGVVVMKVLAAGEAAHGSSGLQLPLDGRSLDLASASVRWACMHPEIATAVVGSASSRELVANVLAVRGVGNGERWLADRWWEEVRTKDRGPCTRCGLCEGVCPSGVPIPKILRLLDQHRWLGIESFPEWKYGTLEVNGSACAQCGRCQDACPEEFGIADLLAEAHATLGGPTQARNG